MWRVNPPPTTAAAEAAAVAVTSAAAAVDVPPAVIVGKSHRRQHLTRPPPIHWEMVNNRGIAIKRHIRFIFDIFPRCFFVCVFSFFLLVVLLFPPTPLT